MANQKDTINRRFATILAVLLTIALIGVVPCITIDGKSYYLQLRSIVYDGDASYYDEMLYHYEGYAPDYHIVDMLPSGYVPNLFPLGFAVILTPFFLLGHVAALILHGIGWGPPPVGYSFPEVLFTLLASAGLGSLGVWLSGVIAGRIYGVRAAFWATMGIWLASPLPAYMYAQPSFAHSVSVFTSCAVLLIWLHQGHDQVVKRGLGLGLAIGLAALVRWQDGVLLLLPACDVIRYWKHWRFWRSLRYLLMVGIGVVVAVMPQLVLWKIHYGQWITIPQGQGFMRWLDPQILPVLFGARHGLISWTPIMAIAIAAMIWMAIRKPSVGIPLLVVLMAQVYVNSAALDWWAGWGFGGRRFLDMVPFFILATTFLIREMPKVVLKIIPFLIGALIVWNGSLLYHYFTGHVDYGGDVYFSQWCTENWKFLTQMPLVVIGGIIVIVGMLWVSQRQLKHGKEGLNTVPIQWMPSIWLMVLAILYIGGWTLNLARTTIDIEKMQVLNPEPRFREWSLLTQHEPFEGSGLEDIVTKDTPWHQFASWSVKPGGKWRLVTACEGNLTSGDTAAVLVVEGRDGSDVEIPLQWNVATGPRELPAQSMIFKESGVKVSRIDLPPVTKAIPYRTFGPLPVYFARWGQLILDYSKGRIPLYAAYEYSFTIPDNLIPNRFNLYLREAELCYIYGIGRIE